MKTRALEMKYSIAAQREGRGMKCVVDAVFAAIINPAWVGHYRIGQGSYDTDRALLDFMTWPPIARRIFELQQEKQRLAK